MLSGKVAPPEWKSLLVFHGHLRSISWPWALCSWASRVVTPTGFHFSSWIVVSSRVAYPSLFSFFPSIKFTKSHVWEVPWQLQEPRCCRAHQRATAVDGTGACRMLFSFGVCSHRETNWKWVAEGFLLNFSIIFLDGKQKRPCPVPKNPNSLHSASKSKRACVAEYTKS